MTCIRNLRGERFGRLQVVELGVRPRKGKTMWVCLCDCGQTKSVSANCLQRGVTRSCGCLRREVTSAMRQRCTRRYAQGSTQ